MCVVMIRLVHLKMTQQGCKHCCRASAIFYNPENLSEDIAVPARKSRKLSQTASRASLRLSKEASYGALPMFRGQVFASITLSTCALPLR